MSRREPTQPAGGFVSLVGAGPGDPGLITVRGAERIGQADAVLYDALVNPVLLDQAPPGAERIVVGKRAGQEGMPQHEIQALMIRLARESKRVVRLKGGDPLVFGRGGEEAEALRAAGVPFEVVPGVTAGLGGAAYAGIPVTYRGLSSSVTLVTGHEADREADSSIDWAALARLGGTLVFYMGVGRLRAVVDGLITGGMAPSTPACVIQRATWPDQRSIVAELDELSQAVEQARIGTPAVVVIGPAVSLRDRIQWFEETGGGA